jgi:hypothetical protein
LRDQVPRRSAVAAERGERLRTAAGLARLLAGRTAASPTAAGGIRAWLAVVAAV